MTCAYCNKQTVSRTAYCAKHLVEYEARHVCATCGWDVGHGHKSGCTAGQIYRSITHREWLASQKDRTMLQADAPPCFTCGTIAVWSYGQNTRSARCPNDKCPEAIFCVESLTDETRKERSLVKDLITKGLKLDHGKPRWDLLPYKELGQIVDVLTFGAKKYADDNWQLVENGEKRYFRAAVGHLASWRSGEKNDPESGLPHLAHAGCNILFLLWFDNKAK